MKAPFKSIQWRLQAWHGAILLAVLVAFGCTAYQLARQNRFKLIDEELDRRGRELIEQIMPTPGSPDFLKMLQNARPGNSQILSAKGEGEAPGGIGDQANLIFPANLPNPLEALRNAPLKESKDFYFALLEKDGTFIRRSRNAPENIPPIAADLAPGLAIRTRGDLREHLMVTKAGFAVLVGRSVAGDLGDLHRQAWLMVLIGGGVALLGLAGGRLLAARAIKPIADISAAVQKITSGNLAQRINLAETDNELGQLAADLNATFDRLQSAFGQLQWSLDRQAQFTADASHELRTPVAVILAETNSGLARDRAPEDYRAALETCRRAARRMHRLTESLLMLARLDSGAAEDERRSCSLDRLTHDTLELLGVLADDHQVSLHAELTPATVVGDANQLGQVVSNLVSNAIFYNRPGGNVRVKLAPAGEQIELTVADDGQGISTTDLPHIFERFYRADQSRSQTSGHTGLGLAIAKAIVQSHRGTIQAVSTPGQGSTFTVRLPRQNA